MEHYDIGIRNYMIGLIPNNYVLGPILFIIYVNDITHPTLFNGSMSLFADDILIYRPIHTPEDLAILQSDIDSPTSSIMLFVYLCSIYAKLLLFKLKVI